MSDEMNVTVETPAASEPETAAELEHHETEDAQKWALLNQSISSLMTSQTAIAEKMGMLTEVLRQTAENQTRATEAMAAAAAAMTAAAEAEAAEAAKAEQSPRGKATKQAAAILASLAKHGEYMSDDELNAIVSLIGETVAKRKALETEAQIMRDQAAAKAVAAEMKREAA